MKLDDINLDGVGKLQLLHPGTGEKLYNDDKSPMTIDLLGDESKQFRKALAKISNSNVRAGTRRRQATFERTEEQACELLAAVTTNWNLQIGEESKIAEFSIEAAEKLYLAKSWVRKQVDEYVGDANNFLANASKT